MSAVLTVKVAAWMKQRLAPRCPSPASRVSVTAPGLKTGNHTAATARGARHTNTETSFACKPVLPAQLSSAPPSPPPHHPPLHHQTHRSPVTPFTFLRWPRPLLGFVQIGLFASPELPISGRRHQRVEGRADVERESPRGEGTAVGGGRVPPALTLMRGSSLPLALPVFLHPPPSVLRRCWRVGSPPTPVESQAI